MDRRRGERRAFGSQLSANTPLPLPRHDQHQLPLTKTIQKQKPWTSVKKKKKNATNIVFHDDDAEARRCASERKLPATTMERSPNIGLDSGSSPLFTPGSSDRVRSDGVRTGRNLIDNFNSPSITNNDNDIYASGSNRIVSFSPNKSGEADSTSWTKFTPKIAWRKGGSPDDGISSNNNASPVAQSSTTMSAIIGAFSPMHTHAGEMIAPFLNSFVSSPLSTMRDSPLQQLPPRIDGSEFPSQQLSAHTETTVPPSFAMQQLSVTTNSEMFSMSEDVFIGPLEYAIRFPVNGESLLHLEFEPVTVTSGRPTGCGIAKILPGLEKSNACYLIPYTGADGSAGTKEEAIATPTKTMNSMIQVNDLIVSINGVSVLSRKYDFIMELLLQKFKNDDKIIVFRSIEKIWRSRSNGGNNQFSIRTMRNIRTGRRVATALNDDMMEDDLHSWVTTPTQVALSRRRDEGNSANLFSPSNIKKISTRGRSTSNTQSMSPPLTSSRSPSRPHSTTVGVVEPLAVTVKKCNTRNSMNQYFYEQSGREDASLRCGEIAVSPAHITMERIGKALTGEGVRGDKGGEFERSLRLKKDLLNELKNVHSELEGLHMVNERNDEWSHVISEKEQIFADHAATENIQLSSLKSQVDELKSERFNTLQTMIDMQAQLDDARSNVQELNELETVKSELLLSNKKLEETIALIQSDRDAAWTELEKERSASSELTAKLADAVENVKIVSEALEAEKLNSSHRAVSYTEQIRSLEVRLSEEEQKARESSIAHSSIVAELEKRITYTESERDSYHLDLERGRLALTVSESERDGIASDLDKARSIIDKLEEEKTTTCSELIESKVTLGKLQEENRILMSNLAAEKSSTVQLMSQVEKYATNLKTVELEKKECMDLIASLNDEKEEVEHKLKETIASLESSINDKLDKCASLNGIITSSNGQVKILKEQVSTLMETNVELEQKVEKATAALSTAEEAAYAERMQFHERDATRVEHVRRLEERLDSEAKRNVESAETIAKLETLLVTTQSDYESNSNELEKERLALKDMDTLNRVEMQRLKEQLTEAERENLRMISEYQDLERELYTVKHSESQLNKMICTLNGRIKELEDECESQHSVIEKHLVEINVLRDEVVQKDKLQSELNSLSIALEESDLELANVTRDRGLLEQRIDDLVRDLTLTDAKRKDDQDSYEQSSFTHENEKAALKVSLALAESAISHSKIELSEEKSSLNRLRTEFDRSKQELVVENESLNLLLESRTAEITAIQSVNKSLTDRITHLSNDLKETQTVAVYEKAELSAQLIVLSTKLNDADNDRKKHDAHCTDLMSKLEAAEDLLDEGDEEIQKLNFDCQRLEEENQDMYRSLKNAEETITQLRCEKESLHEVKQSLVDEMKLKADRQLEEKRELKLQQDELLNKLEETQNEARLNRDIVADLRSKLHSTESSLAEVQNEVKLLSAKLATFSSNADDLRSEKDTLLSNLAEAQKEASLNREIVTDFTSKLQTSEESLAEARNQLKLMVARAASLSSTADHLRSEKDTQLNNLLKSQKETILNRKIVTDLTSKLETCEESLAEAQNEVKELVDQLANLSLTADNLRSDKDTLLNKLAESQKEASLNREIVTDLRSKLQTSEESLSDARNQLELMVAQVSSLSSNADHLCSEKDTLLKLLAESQKEATLNKDKVIDLTSKLQTSEESLTYAQNETKKLVAQVASLSSTADDLPSDKDSLLKHLAESQKEATLNKDKVTDLTSKLHNSVESLANAQNEVKELVAQVSSLSSIADDLRSDKGSLLKHLTESQKEATLNKDIVTDLTSKLHNSVESLANAQNEMKELVAQVASLSSTADDLRSEKDFLLNIIKESQNEASLNREIVTDLRSKLQTSEESLSDARNQLELMVARAASFSSTADDLRSDKDSLLKHLAESRKEATLNKDKVTDLTSKLHSSAESLANAQNEMKELVAQVASLSLTADDLRSEKDTLLNNIKESQNEASLNREIVTDLTSKLQSCEESLAKAQNEVKELVAQVESLSLVADDLRSDKDSLLKHLAESQKEATLNKDKVTDLTSKLHTSEESLAEAQNEMKELLAQVASLSLVADDLRSEKDTLLNNIKESQHEASLNRDIVTDLTFKLDTCVESLVEKENEMKELVAQLASISSLADDLRSEKDALLTQFQSNQEMTCQFLKGIDVLLDSANGNVVLHSSFEIEHESGTKQEKDIKSLNDEVGVNSRLTYGPRSAFDYCSENHTVTPAICHQSLWIGEEVGDFCLLLRNLKDTLVRLKDDKLSLETDLSNAICSRNQLLYEKESTASDLELNAVETLRLNDVLTNMKSLCDSDKTELAGNISELEMHLVRMKASLESKEVENSALVYQLRESKATFDDLTTEISCAESQYQSQIESFENRIKELVQQNNVLSTTTQKLSDRAEQLEAQSDTERLSHELATKQASIYVRNLQNLLAGSEVKQLHLTKELDTLKSTLESKDSDFLKALQEKDSHLASMDLTVKTMEHEIKRLKSCIASAENMIGSLTSEGIKAKDSMKVELDNARESYESMRDCLTANIQRLQGELILCQQALSQSEGCNRDREATLVAELSVAKRGEHYLLEQIKKMEQLLNAIESKEESSKDRMQQLHEELNICQQSLSKAEELHREKEANLVSELSTIGQREHDLLEQVKETERLLNACHDNCDILKKENCERRQLTLELSSDLQAQKEEVCNLEQLLKEETALSCSLSESNKMNERTVHEQSAKIAQLGNELELKLQSSISRESELTGKLDELAEDIDAMQTEIKFHVCEKDSFAKRIEDYNKTHTELRSKLAAVYQELASLSRIIASSRTSIADEISNAKTTAEEFINRFLLISNRQKHDLQHQIETLRNELQRKQIEFNAMLSINDEESKELAKTNTANTRILEDKLNATVRELSILTSKNADLENIIQKEEESNSTVHLTKEDEVSKLQGECYVANKKLELATIKLDREKSMFDRKIASLQATVQEKCLLNRSLAARLEVASLSSHRANAIGEIALAKEDAMIDFGHESDMNELKRTLETRDNSIKKLSTDLSRLRHKIVALETECRQAHDHNEKLGSRYERIVAEMEACREHTIDLKAIIIEKNKEIELKEGVIMELQYKVDFLEAQADGWKISSLNTADIESKQCRFSSDDVSDMISATTKRHYDLSSDFAKLEEKCSRMEDDFRQRTSMHEAIVDGLESECKTLFHEIDDFQTDLHEKQVYIASLEEAKARLENDFNALMNDRDDACSKLSELQHLCSELRQEKEAAEILTNRIISAARKLANVAIDQGCKLDWFPINSISPSSWSENMDIIAQFIEHASRANQKQNQIIAPSQICYSDTTPPRSEGGKSPVTVDLVSQHYDVLEDLKRMKHAIASAMASPKLTPIKCNRREEGDSCDELYANLMKAHEQLDSLSMKIQSFQDEQMKWKEWETYYGCRIAELESENQIMKAAAIPEASQVVKMKEISSVLIHIFQHRHRRSVVQRAFQAWVSQTRMSRHVVIVKDMAKELAMTRKKVLLLKSHIESNS